MPNVEQGISNVEVLRRYTLSLIYPLMTIITSYFMYSIFDIPILRYRGS